MHTESVKEMFLCGDAASQTVWEMLQGLVPRTVVFPNLTTLEATTDTSFAAALLTPAVKSLQVRTGWGVLGVKLVPWQEALTRLSGASTGASLHTLLLPTTDSWAQDVARGIGKALVAMQGLKNVEVCDVALSILAKLPQLDRLKLRVESRLALSLQEPVVFKALRHLHLLFSPGVAHTVHPLLSPDHLPMAYSVTLQALSLTWGIHEDLPLEAFVDGVSSLGSVEEVVIQDEGWRVFAPRSFASIEALFGPRLRKLDISELFFRLTVDDMQKIVSASPHIRQLRLSVVGEGASMSVEDLLPLAALKDLEELGLPVDWQRVPMNLPPYGSVRSPLRVFESRRDDGASDRFDARAAHFIACVFPDMEVVREPSSAAHPRVRWDTFNGTVRELVGLLRAQQKSDQERLRADHRMVQLEQELAMLREQDRAAGEFPSDRSAFKV